MSIELIDDTDTVSAELESRICRFINLEHETEKRATARVNSWHDQRSNCQWIQNLLQKAAKGRHTEWLEGKLEDLESEGFIEEELKGVPEHIINHTIALCKQAIANQTPSLV